MRLVFRAVLVFAISAVVGCRDQGPDTYAVSGSVRDADGAGIAGVTIEFSDGTSPTVTSVAGAWSVSQLNDLVTVTPLKSGYSFTPVTRTVSHDETRVDFTAQYSVSGRVQNGTGLGVGGVTISFSGGLSSVTTASDGTWTKSGLSGTVIVTPTRNGYNFTPLRRSVTEPATNVGFTASTTVYAVGGTVRDGAGGGIGGVTISFSGGFSSVTTVGDGTWSKPGLIGSVTVTPSRTGYTFAPLSRSVTEAATNVDFTGLSTPSTVVTPVLSPGTGTYSTPQTVTITTTTAGAAIYYTTDGSTPTEASAPYSSPLTIASNTTVQARAFLAGWAPSTTASATYTITGTVATPVLSPGTGTYSVPQTVTITTSTADAAIYYTTDGSTPTEASTPYSSPLTIASTTTVQVRAFLAGWTPSTTASATYTITGAEIIGPPSTPSGPGLGAPGITYTYSTGGASSSLTHPVEYRFDWGDGNTSTWGAAQRSKSWNASGPYSVRAQARCALHPERLSDWSNPRLVTIGAPPSPPVLISPADGAIIRQFAPRFEWSAPATARWYDIEVDDAPSFATPVVTGSTLTEPWFIPSSAQDSRLTEDATFYWRVRAANEHAWGPWSPTRSFTIDRYATIRVTVTAIEVIEDGDAIGPGELYGRVQVTDVPGAVTLLSWTRQFPLMINSGSTYHYASSHLFTERNEAGSGFNLDLEFWEAETLVDGYLGHHVLPFAYNETSGTWTTGNFLREMRSNDSPQSFIRVYWTIDRVN